MGDELLWRTRRALVYKGCRSGTAKLEIPVQVGEKQYAQGGWRRGGSDHSWYQCSGPRESGAQPTRSSQSAPAAFDACALLTKQEAATAVGEAVGEPKPLRGQSGAPGMSVVHCEYESATSQSVQVTVWRFSGDTASMSLQIYRS